LWFVFSRGIYFAEKSEYSHCYAYQPSQRPIASADADGRSVGQPDEREMFLTKLLAGNVIKLNRDDSPQKAAECRALTVPPTNPRTNLKYNTVTGHTGGSQVWIVYENGRAYPDYLVRYYRGKHDLTRTPFVTKAEAVAAQKSPPIAPPNPVDTTSTTEDSDEDDMEAGQVGYYTWEYHDAGYWKKYSPGHQAALEAAYQDYVQHPASSVSYATIRSDDWGYRIDFPTMTQTNVEHQNHTQRKVQRRLFTTV
jgi:WWE domain